MVLINPGGMVHPMHLHGQHFWLLGSGNGYVLDGQGAVKYEMLNTVNPAMRDTHTVPHAIAVPQDTGSSTQGQGQGQGGGGAAGDLRLAADELLLLLGHVCMPAFAPGLAYACARYQAVAHGLARAAVAAAGAPGISRELALMGARFCAAVGYVQAGAQPALPDATEGV